MNDFYEWYEGDASDYDDTATWTSGHDPFDDTHDPGVIWITSSYPYNANNFLDELEIARSQHFIQMQADQKRWWFEGVYRKIQLYDTMIGMVIIFRKILRCNRRGLGLRIRAEK